MLYALAGILFEIAPLNVDGFERTTGADYAEKGVFGVRPLLEFVGEAAEEWSFHGTLFSEVVQGGVAALEALRAASRDGKSRQLTRGDGTNMGWWKISQLREAGSRMDRQGVARVSAFDLTLKRAQTPDSADGVGVQR